MGRVTRGEYRVDIVRSTLVAHHRGGPPCCSGGRRRAAGRSEAAEPRHRAGGLRRASSTVWLVRRRSQRGGARPMAVTVPAATEQIDYADLYARWERGNWSAMDIDFTQDRIDWHEHFTDEQRRGGAVALHAVLPRRGLRRRQPVAVHRRRAAGGAEVLPRDAAGRRGAPRGLLSPLHARGRRRRRRLAGRRAARHEPGADAGATARLFGRLDRMADELRWDRSPLHARQGGDALPRRRRGRRSPSPAST